MLGSWKDGFMERPDAAFYAHSDGGIFGKLLDFLNRLDRAHISYKLRHTRPDSVMIDISLPGWRWEVEFMIDGSLDTRALQVGRGSRERSCAARSAVRGAVMGMSGGS